MFSLIINELAKSVISRGHHGIQLVQDAAEIFLLLFADDVALVSSTPSGLQNQLNILHEEAVKLKLVVNLDKTNVVVFRNGGPLARKEKWLYGESPLVVVNAYKYLGLSLTSKLSKVKAVLDFVPKAKRKVVSILNALNKINCSNWNVFCKLLDTQVLPGLLYASEIWGSCRLEIIDRVQVFAIKQFLRLPSRTPTLVVYGDSGRFPLVCLSQIRCVKYWLRIIKLDHDRLPRMAYHSSYCLAEIGKKSWAGGVKQLLLSYGFGEVWYNQGVGDDKSFLSEFSQRLRDCFQQNWHEKLMSSEDLISYRSIKGIYGIESVIFSMESKFRAAILKLRAGVSWVNLHRLFNHPHIYVSCPFCPDKIEDDLHFLFQCQHYSDFRPHMLVCQYNEMINVFYKLLTSTNIECLRLVASFYRI